MTHQIQNQADKELAERIKANLTDATYRIQTAQAVTAKTNEDLKAAAQRYINLFIGN